MLPLGVTIGDAAGVGPELILLHADRLLSQGACVVYGSVALLEGARRSLARVGASGLFRGGIDRVESAEDAARIGPGTLAVVEIPIGGFPGPVRAGDGGGAGAEYPWGEARPEFGRLQYEALVRAISDARGGRIAAILTAPWHKARLQDAGIRASGHTEVLEREAGVDRATMVLAGERLRVALVTAHLPLREVAEAITPEAISGTVRALHAGLVSLWGIPDPVIAVCGLNPHAGESGTLGDEEERIIRPEVARLAASGLRVTGPHPSDTLFPRAAAGADPADGIVAMYHDQGLGPLKTHHFGAAANVTLGLGFVRTSPDHGTAYDIAGRGVVSGSSWLYASELARRFGARDAANAIRARSGMR